MMTLRAGASSSLEPIEVIRLDLEADQGSGSAPGAAAWPALPGYSRQVSTLAVVGAGPKGIAIAAKARALAAAGLPAPRVVLVDRGEVAGNWAGRQGYTSGLLPLGTPPEKDVGYP